MPGKDWEDIWNTPDGILKQGTKFDASGSSPALAAELKREDKPLKRGRAAVPGCGRGYDLAVLLRYGYESATGIEISKTAKAEAQKWLKTQEDLDPNRWCVKNTNWFEMNLKEIDKFDFIYDYTFFCAMYPEQRKDWAKAHADNLKQDGEIFLLVFPCGDNPEARREARQEAESNQSGEVPLSGRGEGPPFVISKELALEYLNPYGFKLYEAYRLPEELSHPGRGGREWVARFRRE
eukprot:Clim_evm7s136 gene=Clim_evmTU7s136